MSKGAENTVWSEWVCVCVCAFFID